MKLFLAVLAVLSCGAVAAHADTITIHLNQSNESYTLVGAGGSNGYATYFAQPGACTSGATLTTCLLTGTYTGSTPGYTAGTYTLTSSFANSSTGLAASSTEPVSSPSGGNYFTLGAPTPDVNVSLKLQDVSGVRYLPMVIDGVDLGNTLLVDATNSVCSGLAPGTPCTQAAVGLTTSASISSPVTGEVIYSFPMAATPEPAWLALGGMLPGAYGLLRRRLRRNA